jgi:hypothetical protein
MRYFEHCPGTHGRAHGASGARLGVKFQSYSVFKINEPAHKNLDQTKMEIIQETVPRANAAICAGTAILISFFTPERDVNVEHPVKLMAR